MEHERQRVFGDVERRGEIDVVAHQSAGLRGWDNAVELCKLYRCTSSQLIDMHAQLDEHLPSSVDRHPLRLCERDAGASGRFKRVLGLKCPTSPASAIFPGVGTGARWMHLAAEG